MAVKLSNSGSDADGVYESKCSASWARCYSGKNMKWGDYPDEFDLYITGCDDIENKDWEIRGQTGVRYNNEGMIISTGIHIIFWKCPNSANCYLPPKTGWEPVDRIAAYSQAKPTIEYIYKSND